MTSVAPLIGEVRRFGIVGPLYEIVGHASAAPQGEPLARIRLVDSGEETDYPWSALMADPVEA